MNVRAPLLLVLSLFLTNAADDAPAGMVMALSSSTMPSVTVMAEIPAGTPLRLASGTELTFPHYARCKLITVADGSLTVTRVDFTTDGKIVAEKDGPCPAFIS